MTVRKPVLAVVGATGAGKTTLGAIVAAATGAATAFVGEDEALTLAVDGQLLLRDPLEPADEVDLLGPLADTGSDFAQPPRSFNRRQGFPARLRALSGQNRAPGIFRAAVGNTRKQRFRRRIDHINPCITAAGFKLAVNIHRVLNGCCHGLLLRIIVFNR